MKMSTPPPAEDRAAIVRVPLEEWTSPEKMMLRLGGDSAFLLDSAGEVDGFTRWSLLGSHPVARFTSQGGRNYFHNMSHGQTWNWNEAPLPALRRAMASFPQPESVAGIPFSGGAVGLMSYELGRSLLPVTAQAHDDLGLPELSFFFFNRFLLFDRKRGMAWAVAYARAANETDARREARLCASELAVAVSKHSPATREVTRVKSSGKPLPLSTSLSADAYRRAVQRCIDDIHEGEAYELCLTGRYETEFEGDSFTLYRELRRQNPAPYAAYLRFPEATLISSSPERFLRVDREGRVEARPIKGTRPRGKSPVEDARLRSELKASRKDRAENTMIVDLLRNDLARVCKKGSVEVPQHCVIEDYATVFQMVSTITGQLAHDKDRFDLLASAFPGGSMTGAPKIAAMKILEEIEPVVRGYYSGAMGYLSFDGACDLSMVIRSIQLVGRRALVGAGGAVVAASDPDEEWKEAMLKARGPLQALASVQGFDFSDEAK
jgi:para-aminobenzoate synthetase component I